MSVVEFVKQGVTQGILDEMNGGDYLLKYVEANQKVLNGDRVDISTLEEDLKLVLSVVDTNIVQMVSERGLDRGKATFSVLGYSNEEEGIKADRVTITARITLGEKVIKNKEIFEISDNFEERFIKYVHAFELEVVKTLIALHNVEVLNVTYQEMLATREEVAPIEVTFAVHDKPIKDIRENSVVIGIDVEEAVNTLPKTGFGSYLEYKDLLNLIEAEEKEAEEARIEAEEEAARRAETQAQIDEMAVGVLEGNTEEAEIEVQPEDEMTEEEKEAKRIEEAGAAAEAYLDSISENILRSAEDEEEEEVEELTEEEQAELAYKRNQNYENMILSSVVNEFATELFDMVFTSSTPLEFIRKIRDNETLFSLMAGGVTKIKVSKVIPLLRDSFKLTEKTLPKRKEGYGLLIEVDAADADKKLYTVVMKEDKETQVVAYPKFDGETLLTV